MTALLLFILSQGLLSLAETPLFSKTLLTAEQNEPDQAFILVETLPRCENDEFVTFNGSQLICKALPLRECNCPDILPKPPEGCQRFAPPSQGGFVCLKTEDTIYCSVQCDNTSEFSAHPLNPYRCGPVTKFLWTDFADEAHKELPQCDSFRLSRRPVFPESNYLPVPCHQLTAAQEIKTFEDLLLDLQLTYRCSDCNISQAYVQCPPATS